MVTNSLKTNQLFDDDQTYSNLIQGFMDDLDYKLENMGGFRR